VALGVGDNAADLANVLHSILEQHEVHDGIDFVVLAQALLETSAHCLARRELVVEVIIKGGSEPGEDENLRGSTEVLLEVELGEGLRAQLLGQFSIPGHVSMRHQSVTVDTLGLVHPELDEVVRLLDGLGLGVE
jgi:hypothetical protein